MSSNDSSESSSENEQEVGLTPYMFEPKRTREQLQQYMKTKNEEEQQGEEEIKQPRVGHNTWCLCQKNCKEMTTETESLCCRDNNDITDDLFQGFNLFLILS